MKNLDIFSLTDNKYIKPLNSVDNPFIRQLYALAVNSAKSNKMLSIVMNSFLSSRSVVENNSILNICQLTPLIDKDNDHIVIDIGALQYAVKANIENFAGAIMSFHEEPEENS